jgi:Holliday junction resolvasome RuvABC DNA-binding subunit
MMSTRQLLTIPPGIPLPLDNQAVAARLDEVGELLEGQGANPYRARAYHRAADTIRGLETPLSAVLDSDGLSGLTELPGIGDSIARSVQHLLATGELPILKRLQGRSQGDAVLTTVPGVGQKTAARIHSELGIETLADLEIAAYDGRLARLPGLGSKRLRAIRESLAGRFRRKPSIPVIRAAEYEWQPPVAELLSIDDEYRRKGAAGWLLQVAPSRFNAAGEAWLPILHAHREGRRYTAMYSNTARAHELGTTHDWVVIYREGAGDRGQWTVVTSHHGRLKGKRVVRGREVECEAHYTS